jgi:hypothetical protein
MSEESLRHTATLPTAKFEKLHSPRREEDCSTLSKLFPKKGRAPQPQTTQEPFAYPDSKRTYPSCKLQAILTPPGAGLIPSPP